MFGKKDKAATENGKRDGFIKRLRSRINSGDNWLTYDLANVAPGGKIDEDSLVELESLLVMADVGIATTERIIGDLQKSLARKELKDKDALRDGLRRSILAILEPVSKPLNVPQQERPFVILMVGVNGAGKTSECQIFQQTQVFRTHNRYRSRSNQPLGLLPQTRCALAIPRSVGLLRPYKGAIHIRAEIHCKRYP